MNKSEGWYFVSDGYDQYGQIQIGLELEGNNLNKNVEKADNLECSLNDEML